MKFQASRLCLGGGVLPDPRISRMAPGHGGVVAASTRPLLCVPIFGRRGGNRCALFFSVPPSKGVNVLCFPLGSRLSRE